MYPAAPCHPAGCNRPVCQADSRIYWGLSQPSGVSVRRMAEFVGPSISQRRHFWTPRSHRLGRCHVSTTLLCSVSMPCACPSGSNIWRPAATCCSLGPASSSLMSIVPSLSASGQQRSSCCGPSACLSPVGPRQDQTGQFSKTAGFRLCPGYPKPC